MNNENSVDKVVSYVSQAPSIATTTTNATNASYETNHRRGIMRLPNSAQIAFFTY